jgi:hypothetical protein
MVQVKNKNKWINDLSYEKISSLISILNQIKVNSYHWIDILLLIILYQIKLYIIHLFLLKLKLKTINQLFIVCVKCLITGYKFLPFPSHYFKHF